MQVVEIVEPILKDLVDNQPLLDEIVIQELDLGHLPLRLAGLKVYDTKDDEVILEAPIQWGSAVKVRCAAALRCRGGLQATCAVLLVLLVSNASVGSG